MTRNDRIAQDLARKALEDVVPLLNRSSILLDNEEQRGVFALAMLMNLVQLEVYRLAPEEPLIRMEYRGLLMKGLRDMIDQADARDAKEHRATTPIPMSNKVVHEQP